MPFKPACLGFVVVGLVQVYQQTDQILPKCSNYICYGFKLVILLMLYTINLLPIHYFFNLLFIFLVNILTIHCIDSQNLYMIIFIDQIITPGQGYADKHVTN